MRSTSFLFAFAVIACTSAEPLQPASSDPVGDRQASKQVKPDPKPSPTRVLDRDTAHRLKSNSGLTLQWIGWEKRGHVRVTEDDRGVWHISGEQTAPAGQEGKVAVEGIITEIGDDHFLLDGTVTIADTPDAGRHCEKDKVWRFATTQGRKYWRLREFEWCDYLTDYVDIYF